MTWQDFFQWYNGLSEQDRLGIEDGAYEGEFFQNALSGLTSTANDRVRQAVWDYAKNKFGDDYLGLQGYLTNVRGFTYNPEWEQWLQNMINVQNTNDARAWEENMRDSELTSTASQLSSLGLNPASVVSMGRGSVPNVAAADVGNMDSGKQRASFRFEQKENMLKRVFSILGGMASAGIGGAAYGTARGIAAKMSRSTMNSARRAFARGSVPSSEMFHGHPVSDNDWDDIMKEIYQQ